MFERPVFPTDLHKNAAGVVYDYFSSLPEIDTVLSVNSCARGQAVPESDLDFAVLAKPGITAGEIQSLEAAWQEYSASDPVIAAYKSFSKFSHLHLDVISGIYTPTQWEIGVVSDSFELEIGNQVCYSAPMGEKGPHFRELQNKWLPYYSEELRSERFEMVRSACSYDLEHIPLFADRGLFFQAFDILGKAFQEYLQLVFIANRTYPIAYNKWIKYQFTVLLKKPELYPKLLPVLSVSNFESREISDRAALLAQMLYEIVYI